ncbi:MAG: hypothetical protein U0746_16630 [Gemmataceae bacterium]
MPELTLEALAQRVTRLEQEVATLRTVAPATRDWREVVGMFAGSEFMLKVDEEIQAMRAAEQTALDAEDGT